MEKPQNGHQCYALLGVLEVFLKNIFDKHLEYGEGFPDCSAVKNPPAVREMQETRVGSLSRGRFPEAGNGSRAFLPRKLHGQSSPRGLKESDRTEQLSTIIW